MRAQFLSRLYRSRPSSLTRQANREREQLARCRVGSRPIQDATAEEIEKAIYDLGRANYDKPGKIFPVLYRMLLGQERGPRLGAFIRLATPEKIAHSLRASLA